MAKLKVLAVDDEPGIRSGIARILRNYSVGYPFMDEDFEFDIIEAESGEQAIEIVKSQAIDIILLDNKLPGIDGVEVLEYLSKEHPDILVTMITSYASLDLAVKATKSGAYNFVPKPFTPEEMRSSMDNITKHLFLKRMTQKMHEEGKAIRFQFLSVLSHELKSPINAVEGYLKVMQDRQAGADLEAYDKMIGRSLERIKGMRNLIADLLDLTKIESGKKTKEIKEVAIADCAKNVIEALEPMANQRGIKTYLHHNNGHSIKTDQDEIEIIFNNLISNAIKYNKENGEINITIKENDRHNIIIVEDTGIGMDQEEQSKLFQEFVRIKNSKTKNITGSGLGLSIVKKLVDSYEGEILVDSEPDKGSKFTILLPR